MFLLLEGGYSMAKYNLERMKKIAELSNVPLERILAFQLQESSGGNPEYLAGDRGKSGGDLHLHKDTALLLTRRGGVLANKKLNDKIKSLKTTPGKGQVSEYTTWLVENEDIQDKLLVALLKDTQRQANRYVNKIFNREATDEEHYAFWNAHPDTAKEAISMHFKSKDPSVQVLQQNIGHFRDKKGSYLTMDEKPTVDISDPYRVPYNKDDIKAWMKKHGWTGKDLGQTVDGEWVGYHPGDIMFEDGKFDSPEEFDSFKESQKTVIEEPTIDPSVAAMKAGLRETKSIMEEPKIPENNDEAIEYSKIRDTGGYEDPAGGDLPSYKHGGHVRKYSNGGAAMLTAGDSGSGGVLPEEEWWKFSVEELKEARQKYPTRSVERERVNQLIRLRMDAQKYKPHEGYKWGGQKDPTGIGAGIGESTITEYDSDGNIVPDEETAKQAYRERMWRVSPKLAEKMGTPKPKGTGVHPSKAHLLAGAEESELTPLDPTKSVDYSVMDRTVKGKEPGAQVKDTTKVTVTEDVTETAPTTKTKSQAEIDAEQKAAQEKEWAAELHRQRMQIAAEIKKINEDQDELVKIDPDRFWKNKGTIGTIVGLIGQAGGAYVSGRFGGPNTFAQAIDKAIDRDIEAQKLDLEAAKNKKIAARKRVELMIDNYTRMTKDEQAKANLDLTKAKIRNENQKLKASVVKANLANKVAASAGKGRSDQEFEQAARLDKSLRKRSLKSAKDGLWYTFPDQATKKKIWDTVTEADKAVNNIKELKALVDDIGAATILPGPFQELDPRMKRSKVLRESLKGALRLEIFGPGVMTDTERALADQIIGDPTKLFTRDKTQMDMLNTLQKKINYGVRQQLKRAGVSIPPSQNDLKIKETLKYKGLPDNDENRAKVIDMLIKLEQKHKTGRYWVEETDIVF